MVMHRVALMIMINFLIALTLSIAMSFNVATAHISATNRRDLYAIKSSKDMRCSFVNERSRRGLTSDVAFQPTEDDNDDDNIGSDDIGMNYTQRKLTGRLSNDTSVINTWRNLCGKINRNRRETQGPISKRLLTVQGGSSSNKKQKKKILILMSDTGGGHRASAQAIDQAVSELFPGKIDVDIVDIWTDHARWPFNRFVPSYRFMAKHPIIWRVFYAYGRFPPTKLFTEIMSRSTCYDQFRRAIERSDPDLVLSVHPLCQHIPIPIIRKMNKMRSNDRLPIPFVTVVTDLGGAHPTWFNKACDLCFVPSEAVRKEALKAGVPTQKIIMHGLPVRPSFWKSSTRTKGEVRADLNLKADVNTVLLMGGGDGVGGLSNIALEIGNTLGTLKESSQMVVVCGHNTGLISQLQSKKWPHNVHAVIKGFLNNIDEYMSASDCLVTKAGPGTIAEAMIRGVPVILSSFLPGQEEGNVPYVVDGKFGIYTGNKPKRISSTVKAWFTDKTLLQDMSARAKKVGVRHSEATRLISRDIGDLILRSEREY